MRRRALHRLGVVGLLVAVHGCGDGSGTSDGGPPSVVCTPGTTACWQEKLATCVSGGVGWAATACPEHQVCVDGACRVSTIAVTTQSLPDGMIDSPYESRLEASGGASPFTWSLTGGELPPGIDLAPNGLVSGTPTAGGSFTFGVEVRDAGNAGATASLTLVVHTEGLAITTSSLPAAKHGLDYSATLTALGGLPPYAWGLGAGTLPTGLTLTSDGRIEGAPGELGVFALTFRVFDHTTPPAWADRELSLTVNVAPLEIFGSQEYSLILTKVVVLPLIVVVEGIPIPYSTSLQARGGLTPYHWSEVAIPAALTLLIATSGIPDGLTLDDDGTLHGAVSDTSQVVTVNVPLANLTLTGFFFDAQAQDSQSPAMSTSAIFLLPTVPVGG
jgi:hypothetical protein